MIYGIIQNVAGGSVLVAEGEEHGSQADNVV